jgi:hypothetical protein
VKNDQGIITYYSYDAHGNVEWLVQDIPGLGKKRIDYTYDLISGKVLTVAYQKNQKDAFYHKYSYDADNRIIEVETSTNGELWQSDARYDYYSHGPLKREEIGHYNIQGRDYTYTINGWLKGINATNLAQGDDPGQDGYALAGANSNFAKDVFGMQLNYFDGDFTRTDSPYNTNHENHLQANNNLYNGNISSWTWNSANKEGMSNPDQVLGYKYQYDELNRIKSATYATKPQTSDGIWNDGSIGAYNTSYEYDGNGNIISLKRNDPQGAPMDDFEYQYDNIGYIDIDNKLDLLKEL